MRRLFNKCKLLFVCIKDMFCVAVIVIITGFVVVVVVATVAMVIMIVW